MLSAHTHLHVLNHSYVCICLCSLGACRSIEVRALKKWLNRPWLFQETWQGSEAKAAGLRTYPIMGLPGVELFSAPNLDAIIADLCAEVQAAGVQGEFTKSYHLYLLWKYSNQTSVIIDNLSTAPCTACRNQHRLRAGR